MNKKRKAPAACGERAGANWKRFQLKKPTTGHKNRQEETGFTIIDLLCVRALVYCVLDLDYTETMATAIALAGLADKKGGLDATII